MEQILKNMEDTVMEEILDMGIRMVTIQLVGMDTTKGNMDTTKDMDLLDMDTTKDMDLLEINTTKDMDLLDMEDTTKAMGLLVMDTTKDMDLLKRDSKYPSLNI